MKSAFHFAPLVTDPDLARQVYGGMLGCDEARLTDARADVDFSGARSHCSWVHP